MKNTDEHARYKIETAIQTFFLEFGQNEYTPTDVLRLCQYILLVLKGKA